MNKSYKIIIIVLFLLYLVAFGINLYKNYQYKNDEYYNYYLSSIKEDNTSSNNKDIDKENNYQTIINHTLKLENQNINNKEDSIDLIKNTAKDQEKKCNNNLDNLENDLAEQTKIYGINFCEIPIEKAKKISNAILEVYKLYPVLKEYLTNITIVNEEKKDEYIAAFKPAYTFATSNTTDKFPFVIKCQIFLNSSYYLNDLYFQNVIENAKQTNYFPNDASEESIIVHELGHALTYVLAIKNNKGINPIILEKEDFKSYANIINTYISSEFSKNIVNEAYYEYIRKYGNISREEFRKNISLYANSTSSSGIILYNETIAEAFHDYYLHRENAKKESLEIIEIINKYL